MTAENTSPLLETKLYVPKARPGLVGRPRLLDRLSRGAESKLTLISAPAGFGKTTLLAEWLAAGPPAERSVAWLSLDPGDNQPVAFWTYLIGALRTVAPGIGASALTLLGGSPQPQIESVLSTLLNELGALATGIVVVLDDDHVVDAPEVQAGMAFLLDHLPPQVHLVIATRADPALPLARLRARGELVEIRAADLRFTSGEAATYLNEVMGLDLAAADIDALEGRTEGWIAALQLAALSMQGRDDPAAFIAGFTGDDRYIVDYLVEEVLRRQPETVRSFLLQTSILRRLGGPLCDAVTGQDGGKAMLEVLDRGNLFLLPLDDRRRWYRYHQLFADVLRAHLLDEQPGLLPDLHRRASAWFERNGEPSEAIRHALAAGDFERAADLIEPAVPGMRQRRQEGAMLAWLDALPDEVIARRPVLSVHYAGALLLDGQLDGVEARLEAAERWLDTTADGQPRPDPLPPGRIVVDEVEFRHLPTGIAIYRAAQALAVGDLANTVRHAQHALVIAAPDDVLLRGSAAGLLGLAYWTRGELEAAHRSYAECLANLRLAGHVTDVLGCALALADIRVAQGRLGEATATLEEALQLAREQDPPVLRGTADMHVGLSQLDVERNDLAAALEHLLTSRESGEATGLPQNAYRWRVAMARLHIAEGNLDGALDQLHEAERVYVSDYFPRVRPIAALKARIWIEQGKLGEALGWASAQGLSAGDELSYLREFEHITLARALLARAVQDRAAAQLDGVAAFLERLLAAAEAGQRTGTVIEILALLALVEQARGDLEAALARIAPAVALAEPAGYVRIMVEAGRSMAGLLELAGRRRIAPSYVRGVLAAFGRPADVTHVKQALIEPLSERELDVLRLLATDLSGPDIAAELVVSLNTVRSHTKSIYAKLGVNNRREAVSRAAELELLSRAR